MVSSRDYQTNFVASIVPKSNDNFMDVSSLLARPLRVYSSLLTTATTGLLTTLTAQSIISQVAFTNVFNKYRFYKTDLVMKIVINSSPFAKGRLLLSTFPYPDPAAPGWVFAASPTISQLSSCPHIEIDIGSGESSDIVIPWSSQNYYERVNSGSAPWSTSYLTVIDPLSGTTTGETAEVNVYMWFKNLEFYLPSPQSAETQQTHTTANPRASAVVKSAGQFASMLGNFPYVGPYAKTLGWVLDSSSKALSSFGFSKPISDAPRTSTQIVPARGFNNMKGVDQSVVLGLDPNNSIDPDPRIVGNTNDDMDLHSFLTRQQYVTQFNWSASQAIDTVLYDIQLSPFSYPNTFLSQTASFFSYFKGSIVMRLSFVKNMYYSGRIAIRFFPATTLTSATSPTSPVIFVDIREKREVVFTVPYASNSPFIAVDGSLGRLVVYVVNPLRALDTMDQDINCFVSWCAGSDFGFAAPAPCDAIRAQSTEQEQIGQLEKRAMTFYTAEKTNDSSYLQANGEMCHSIRSLLQVSTYALSVITNQSLLIDTGWFGGIGSRIPIDYFSRFFRFYRGSRRYKFFVRRFPSSATGLSPPSFTMMCWTTPATGTTPFLPTLSTIIPLSSDFRHVHRVETSDSCVMEVMVPFYSPTYRLLLSNNDVGDQNPSRYLLNFQSLYDSTIFVNPPIIDVYYSVGEDFSFGFPAGCPSAS